ncbi:hypothetical protein [Dyadobacter chenhuakuii]|uniref:DUF2281 domain-containing protein n=1 Tax=Dyadobacter chenhuakuii TaxID=2909339 RepID=A0ABY4XEX5_9BACT|nr:hypothetical protein [Dyadobacter chenhuakuii]MCF2491864.1 hypothetical protein [Dyadobacter chenhuakuii]USJ28972.1 hypothetical protein NFI80_13920 [Dyadobacter chenhuakuii]
MVRTLLVPDNQDVSIQLPKSFVGKQVEVIAFTINEAIDGSLAQDKPLTHYASQNVLAKDWLTSDEDEAWKNI